VFDCAVFVLEGRCGNITDWWDCGQGVRREEGARSEDARKATSDERTKDGSLASKKRRR